jgi:uncharacterized protein involved in exopolysaccharide biosynthesis
MKKHIILILALALAGALHANENPAQPIEGAFKADMRGGLEGQSYAGLEKERDALKAELASVKADLQKSQIEAQYFKVMAAHNDLVNKLTQAGMQIASLQGQLAAANAKAAAIEAQPAKP